MSDTSAFHSADETVQALRDASAYPGCFGTAVEDMEVGGRFRTAPRGDYRIITGISSRPPQTEVFLHWRARNGDGFARPFPPGTRLDYLPPAEGVEAPPLAAVPEPEPEPPVVCDACGLEIDGRPCPGRPDHPEPCHEVEP